jgi:hypothetical protein
MTTNSNATATHKVVIESKILSTDAVKTADVMEGSREACLAKARELRPTLIKSGEFWQTVSCVSLES